MEVGRALIARPKLVLFDEIMAGFSEQETVNLIGIIGDYARRGTTFCIVGHTMRAIMSVSDLVGSDGRGERTNRTLAPLSRASDTLEPLSCQPRLG